MDAARDLDQQLRHIIFIHIIAWFCSIEALEVHYNMTYIRKTPAPPLAAPAHRPAAAARNPKVLSEQRDKEGQGNETS